MLQPSSQPKKGNSQLDDVLHKLENQRHPAMSRHTKSPSDHEYFADRGPSAQTQFDTDTSSLAATPCSKKPDKMIQCFWRLQASKASQNLVIQPCKSWPSGDRHLSWLSNITGYSNPNSSSSLVIKPVGILCQHIYRLRTGIPLFLEQSADTKVRAW